MTLDVTELNFVEVTIEPDSTIHRRDRRPIHLLYTGSQTL